MMRDIVFMGGIYIVQKLANSAELGIMQGVMAVNGDSFSSSITCLLAFCILTAFLHSIHSTALRTRCSVFPLHGILGVSVIS
jgi:hypothetical protein